MDGKGFDWIRLVSAHPFPLNNGTPVASANFISDGKVHMGLLHTLIKKKLNHQEEFLVTGLQRQVLIE